MQNSDGNGIYCDYCGHEYNGNFSYFSFDFDKIEIKPQIHSSSKSIVNSVNSYDICFPCFSLFKTRLNDVVKVRNNGKLICDVSGEILNQINCTYYLCRISNVNVSFDKSMFKCRACGLDIKDGVCTCGSTEFIKSASVDVDDKFAELVFSLNMYDHFVKHVSTVIDNGGNTWTGSRL